MTKEMKKLIEVVRQAVEDVVNSSEDNIDKMITLEEIKEYIDGEVDELQSEIDSEDDDK
jgi:hypothetical protein